MSIQQLPLGFQEKIIFELRSLYNRHGYSQYRMNKFEEYDLYARNKDFLISDSVITFMDRSGKLLALKPDVTLSIVKNSKDDPKQLQKLYYNENVYRVTKSSHSFRELMQVGLECLGSIDDYCICEVLGLAAKSLQTVSSDCILDFSHLGLLQELIGAVGIPENRKAAALKLVGEKNVHELAALCRSCGIGEENISLLKQAVTLSGAPETVLPRLKALLSGIIATDALEQMLNITSALSGSGIAGLLRFDFSVVDDTHYYNGIVFKGFIHGIPSSVLSGGQYDNLMQKMNRSSGAIGFAVYMDALERLDQQKQEYDVDTLLLYDSDTPLKRIQDQVEQLNRQNRSVLVQRYIPAGLRFRQIINIGRNEVHDLENHA